MSTKAQRKQQIETDNAAVAGENIRYFLNSGAQVQTPSDAVKVVLASIAPLMAEHEYLALVDKAGYRLEQTPYCTQRVVEK